MKTPLVSIIISSLNQEKFIERCVASCINQTYPNTEIILVDGGSTDETVDIVKEKFPNVKIVGLPQVYEMSKLGKSGNALQRNTGIKISKGNFLVFIDGDDIIYKKKIEIQIDALLKNPDLGFVYSDLYYREVNKGITYRTSQDFGKYSGYVFDKVLRKNIALIHSILFPRDVIKEVGFFNEKISVSSDWDLIIKITYKKPVLYIDEVVGEYIMHNYNISKKNKIMNKAYMEVFSNLLKTNIIPEKKKTFVKLNLMYCYYINNMKTDFFNTINEISFWKIKLVEKIKYIVLKFLVIFKIPPEIYIKIKKVFKKLIADS